MRLTITGGVREVEAADWDALEQGRSPFLSHAFLAALEDSGSVGPGSGWQPLFVLAHDGEALVGAAPAYVKSHSYGEYIFDWGWAEGAMRAGIDYYPKLVVAVPFTPATGRRLLVAPGRADVRRALIGALQESAERLGMSSVHALFCEADEQTDLVEAGWLPRTTMQYHWRNFGGWTDFDGFLGAMRSKRRREIRRERRKVVEAGIDVGMLRGDEVGAAEWAAMWRFYQDTTNRKWGQAYLKRGFFEQIARTLGDSVRMAVARRDGQIIATALNFAGDGALYGRYWGCSEQHRQLHFETCYYASIDHCLVEGLELYEAGAQGEHKIPRGFLASPIRSAHWLRHPGLHGAIDGFLEQEREHNEAVITMLRERSPFAETPPLE